MTGRGLSWAASAGKTSPTQYFCPYIEAIFRRKAGFGWSPPPRGSGLALPAEMPLLGELPPGMRAQQQNGLETGEMNQLFWSLMESAT